MCVYRYSMCVYIEYPSANIIKKKREVHSTRRKGNLLEESQRCKQSGWEPGVHTHNPSTWEVEAKEL